MFFKSPIFCFEILLKKLFVFLILDWIMLLFSSFKLVTLGIIAANSRIEITRTVKVFLEKKILFIWFSPLSFII